MTGFEPYLQPDGRPRMSQDPPAPPPGAPSRRRDGSGRFLASPSAGVYEPVGSAEQTGALDVGELLRRLEVAEKAEQRRADRRADRAWPRAVVQIVAIVAVVGLLGLCAWLIVAGHLFGL